MIDDSLVAKFPVVIAEPEIQIDMEYTIKLEEFALEIMRIERNVFLTQCKLFVVDSQKKGKLFISGFVKEDIEYASVDGDESIKKKMLGGYVRYLTVKIPFKCAKEIYYNTPPVFNNMKDTSEIDVYTGNQKSEEHNTCKSGQQSFEFITERVFCELAEAKFYEAHVHCASISISCELPSERIFDSFTEKVVLFVKIKLLQNQQVHISSSNLNEHKDNKVMIGKDGGIINKGKLYKKQIC